MGNQVETDTSVAPDPVWRMSTADGMVHEWVEKDPETEDWIAACGHRVPAGAVGDPGDLTCMDCLMRHGSRLADHLDSRWRANLAAQQRDLADEATSGQDDPPGEQPRARALSPGRVHQADGWLDALRRGHSDWRGRRWSLCSVRVR